MDIKLLLQPVFNTYYFQQFKYLFIYKMENRDTTKYKAYKLLFPFIILIAAIFLILYVFFVHSGLNRFGNVSSYYLPIFSFGESEFPPLEF